MNRPTPFVPGQLLRVKYTGRIGWATTSPGFTVTKGEVVLLIETNPERLKMGDLLVVGKQGVGFVIRSYVEQV